MVPVSVRADDQRQDLGNRISFAFIELPVEVALARGSPRAGARGDRGVQGLRPSRRDRRRCSAPSACCPTRSRTRPRASRRARASSTSRSRTSRARGSRVYMLGAELSEAYPVVPLAEQHALVDRDVQLPGRPVLRPVRGPEALPEVDGLPEYLNAEILALAGPQAAPRGTRRAAHADRLARPAARAAATAARGFAVRLAVAGQHDLRVEALDAAERLEGLRVGDVQRRGNSCGPRLPVSGFHVQSASPTNSAPCPSKRIAQWPGVWPGVCTTRGLPGTSSTAPSSNVSAPSTFGGLRRAAAHEVDHQSPERRPPQVLEHVAWARVALLGPGLRSVASSAEWISTRAPASCSWGAMPVWSASECVSTSAATSAGARPIERRSASRSWRSRACRRRPRSAGRRPRRRTS